ncbi:MAG: GGDEF domain-containing protein [Actinobacteria bacterium]|nr:GGDEF domain-containing protein [Actinomycetota bacterium]
MVSSHDPHGWTCGQPGRFTWEAHALGLIADVVSVVRDGRFDWVSPSVTAMLGYSPQELVGTATAALAHPDDEPMREDELPTSAGHVVTGRRVRLRHKDGSWRWAQSRVTREIAADGSLGAVLRCTRDVTEQVELEERAQAAESALTTAVNASPDGFALHRVHRDSSGVPDRFTLLAVNVSARAANPDAEDVTGMDVREYLDDAEGCGMLGLLRRAASSQGPHRLRTTVFFRGRRSVLDVVAACVDDETIVATWRDVSVQADAERLLADAYQRAQSAWDVLHAALDALQHPVVILVAGGQDDLRPDGDPALFVEHANHAAVAGTGVDPEIMHGWELTEAFPVKASLVRPAVLEALATRKPQRFRLHLDGHGPVSALRTLDVSVDCVGEYRVIVSVHDVSRDEQERRRIDERRVLAEQAAAHDALTGLPNRARLEQVLRHALMTCGPGERVGVVFADLDHFKSVNDRYGHHVGDGLLKTVAGRLAGVLRRGQVAARLSGDEFVLVLPGLPADWHPADLLDRIRDAVHRPVDLPGVTLAPAVTLGCYVADPAIRRQDREPGDVLSSADSVMYRAKHRRAGEGSTT